MAGLPTAASNRRSWLPPTARCACCVLAHSFLAPTFEPAHLEEHNAEAATILTLAGVSVAAGLIGIAIGWLMYVRGRPDPAAVTRASGPIYRLLVNKWYVDELYDHRFVDAARALFGAMWAFDVHVIDGIANGLGRLSALGGNGVRRLQTGLVGNYALTIIVGLFLIIVAYGGYAAGAFSR